MGNDNCYKCSSVNGCLAECNDVEPTRNHWGGIERLNSWDQCKAECGAVHGGASFPWVNCAIWAGKNTNKPGPNCWCADN